MTLQEMLKERILALCDKKGISVNKLAVISGLTQSTVDAILKNRSTNPTIRTLKKLAYGFNMNFTDFLIYLFHDDDNIDYE